MAANVETMFSTREKPWHGLGTIVTEAPTSAEALGLAGLNWQVLQREIYTSSGQKIPGYRVNIRDLDEKILGVVSDRYRVAGGEIKQIVKLPETMKSHVFGRKGMRKSISCL